MKQTHFHKNTASGYEVHDSKYFKSSNLQSVERSKNTERLQEKERAARDAADQGDYIANRLPYIPQGRSIPQEAPKKAIAAEDEAEKNKKSEEKK